MRKISIYLFVFVLTLVSLKAQTEPPLNNGWYEISTLDHLRWISENTICWDQNFKLMNDIDATDTKNWNNGEGFSPISPGYPKYPNQKDFTGIFEGAGKTISNLYINRPKEDEVGLFGWLLVKGPIIRNLNLVNCDITGRSGVGAIVGYMQYTVLQNVNVQGKVRGVIHVGMLVGENYGTIKFCSARGEVNAENSFAGGLVGSNMDLIHASYAFCSVKGKRNIGGFIGSNSTGLGNAIGCINNCYCVGSVEGDSLVGGFCPQERFNNIGNCFWNVDSAGIDSSKGGYAKATSEMKDKLLYTRYLWNFDAVWNINTSINDGYPFLDIRTKDQGTGIKPIDTDGNNILHIKTLENLVWMSSNEEASQFSYEIDNDIDAYESKYYFDGMGLIPFRQNNTMGTGNFNGNNHIIDNLYINRPYMDNVGLIAKSAQQSSISNLMITNCIILGKKSVGGLIGYHQGAVQRCGVSGFIMGGSSVGGLIGSDAAYGLSTSFSNCTVSGDSIVGGLVGNHGGHINDCYSMGPVTGNRYIGGLIGKITQLASPDIRATNSYACGLIDGKVNVDGFIGGYSNYTCTTKGCFWDVEVSSVDSSWCTALGKTTSEMKTKATFNKASWDFGIWHMDPNKNKGYPYLLFAEKIVSVEESNSDRNSLSIYPNPLSLDELLNIIYDNNEGYRNFKISIINILGKTIDELSFQNGSVNIQYNTKEKLVKGLYYIFVESDGVIQVAKKFIVE